MLRLLKSLENTGFLPPLRNHDSGPQPPGPQAKLWALYYLAQHYDKLGQTGVHAQNVPLQKCCMMNYHYQHSELRHGSMFQLGGIITASGCDHFRGRTGSCAAVHRGGA